jgi:ribonucleoside-diphosphate reductase alpha chain
MQVDYVLKRNGDYEEMSFEKILNRIKKLSVVNGKCLTVNPTKVTQKVTRQVSNNIPTHQIDELASQICASMATEHPDYIELASRINISNLHKDTSPSFSETIRMLYENVDVNNNKAPLISNELYDIVFNNKTKLNSYLLRKESRDYNIDYFGLKTLEKSYLMKINGKIVERPQYLFMRVSLGIHGNDLKEAIKTYDLMSEKWFIHATPTLFNSGTPRPQLSSCFLLSMRDDSIDGIYNSLRDCALISKWAGGIGIHVHNIRAKNSRIRGTNGISNGLVPMLRVFNNTARYVDQGGGKRNGSIAIYLEPWHGDVFDWLLLRKNHGNEEDRARDLFYALWIPDLFMVRVLNDDKWTLMCPDECPGLSDCYGEEFEKLYTKYEDEGRGKQIRAKDLWYAIVESQIETGTPYICYKDASNRKSNQQNLGTIKSSNLCTEIIEYSSKDEFAVCNLASIGLSKYVVTEDDKQPYFDYDKLYKVTKVVTKNLNKIIDINFYPVPETERSNKLHRPIGIGVQGLADVFAMLKIPFDSDEAAEINEKIFETIYYAAVETSMELSKKREPLMIKYKTLLEKNEALDDIKKLKKELGNPCDEELNRQKYLGSYSSFEGSPMSKGQFQFDLWGEEPSEDMKPKWQKLRKDIMKYGIRNSLLVAPMPTASTSQILSNNECIEPFTSNIYLRRTLAGEFLCLNKHLVQELLSLNLWNENIKNKIIRDNGSIQNIDSIPDNIKNIYKTVWEIGNKPIINMAAGRGKYICQSQSLNLFLAEPEYNKITSMHFYSWKKGLKTGQYYLRTKPVAQAQKFTVEPEKKPEVPEVLVCSRDNPDCEACGS